MDMVEIRALPAMLGLQETGIYVAGFNWFVDYLLFPLIMVSQKMRQGAFRHLWAQLFVWGIRTFSAATQGVVFLLEAQGRHGGKLWKVRIVAEHDSAYDFTVIPVIACLRQYFDSSIRKPGLWMMGHIADPARLLADMERLGVRIQTRVTDEDAG